MSSQSVSQSGSQDVKDAQASEFGHSELAIDADDVVTRDAVALTHRYFELFNQQAFDALCRLFLLDGELMPPFESGIVGRASILAYLQKAAKGMEAFPKDWEVRSLENDDRIITVIGKVSAVLFKVNIKWHFWVVRSHEDTDQLAIKKARIKLIASPTELLSLRDKR